MYIYMYIYIYERFSSFTSSFDSLLFVSRAGRKQHAESIVARTGALVVAWGRRGAAGDEIFQILEQADKAQ